jgi:putative ATP-dependent endonuclease of the OLD family
VTRRLQATLDEAIAVLVPKVGGLLFGGFADNDGKHPARWNRLAAKLDKLLFRWSSGWIEENVVAAVAHDKPQALIEDPVAENDKTGERLRTLADRLDIAERDFETIQAKAGSSLKGLIIAAALVYRS